MKHTPVANFIFLQWLTVDGFQQCNLKLLFRQTRLSSSDSPPLQEIQSRYVQYLMKKKYFYITILLLTVSLKTSFGQDSINKNSITFFIVPVPTVVFFSTLSYERFINHNNSLNLTLKAFTTGSANDNYVDYSIDTWFAVCPSYRHYSFQPNSKRILNWISLYVPISFHKWDSWAHTHFAPMIDKGSDKNIGIGGLVGKRIKLGTNKRFFLDLGIGLAYYFVGEDFEPVAPKFILNFGYGF